MKNNRINTGKRVQRLIIHAGRVLLKVHQTLIRNDDNFSAVLILGKVLHDAQRIFTGVKGIQNIQGHRTACHILTHNG